MSVWCFSTRRFKVHKNTRFKPRPVMKWPRNSNFYLNSKVKTHSWLVLHTKIQFAQTMFITFTSVCAEKRTKIQIGCEKDQCPRNTSSMLDQSSKIIDGHCKYLLQSKLPLSVKNSLSEFKPNVIHRKISDFHILGCKEVYDLFTCEGLDTFSLSVYVNMSFTREQKWKWPVWQSQRLGEKPQ